MTSLNLFSRFQMPPYHKAVCGFNASRYNRCKHALHDSFKVSLKRTL